MKKKLTGRNRDDVVSRRLQTLYRAIALCVCLTVVAVLITVVSWLPRFGNDTNPAENEVYSRYVENGTEEAGAVNTVADMILDYRAFDTLGESNVLLAAVISVMILLRGDRDPENGSCCIPELRPDPPSVPPDPILRGAALILTPAGLIYGIYMILNGHLSAGGGFSGGAVIGAAMILFILAFGTEKLGSWLNIRTWRRLTAGSLLAYTLLKTYSFYTGANHIESIVPLGTPGAILSGGLILPLNICVGIVVSCTMTVFYLLFSRGGFDHGD